MSHRDGVAQHRSCPDAHDRRFELVINGRRLTPAQVAAFKQMTGATILEPGRYWLNPDSGNMGVEGESSPRLNLYGACLRQGMSRRPAAPPGRGGFGSISQSRG